MNAKAFASEMEKLGDPEKASFFPRFFKSGKGEYGEGDKFIGITVPKIRALVKEHHKELSIEDCIVLLRDPIHEIRLAAVLLLVHKYQKAKEEAAKENIVHLYLDNLDYVNNWDLVDSSADKIIGHWLYHYKSEINLLVSLSKEDHLWKQRVSILSTLYFIRKGVFKPTLEISDSLLHHEHDLIHKAVGWMLREVGKKDFQTEYDYLGIHYKKMPRTMLRYAIEKFEEPLRQRFLKGEV